MEHLVRTFLYAFSRRLAPFSRERYVCALRDHLGSLSKRVEIKSLRCTESEREVEDEIGDTEDERDGGAEKGADRRSDSETEDEERERPQFVVQEQGDNEEQATG